VHAGGAVHPSFDARGGPLSFELVDFGVAIVRGREVTCKVATFSAERIDADPF